MKTYLDSIPIELVEQLFLSYFTSDDIINMFCAILHPAYIGSKFNKLYPRTKFWQELWKRDISQHNVPSNRLIYVKYFHIINQFNELATSDEKWQYIYFHGYEQLLRANLPILDDAYITDYYIFSTLIVKNSIDIIDIIISNNILNNEHANQLFQLSTSYGNIAVSQLIYNKVKNVDLNESLSNACSEGHVEMIKFLLSVGATNINEIIREAIDYNERKVIKTLRHLPKLHYSNIHSQLVSVN